MTTQVNELLQYHCSERHGGKRRKLKALLSKGDADDCDTKHNTDSNVQGSELKTAEEHPKKIENRTLIKVERIAVTEWTECVSRNLKLLNTEGNEDNGRAKDYTEKGVQKRKPKTVK